MFLLELNKEIRENYAFYDPSALIELTLSNPRGYSPRLTDSILRGLRGKTLIDVEGKVDIEKGMIKDGINEEVQAEERKEQIETAENKKGEIKTKRRKKV